MSIFLIACVCMRAWLCIMIARAENNLIFLWTIIFWRLSLTRIITVHHFKCINVEHDVFAYISVQILKYALQGVK